ncbi:MAG: DUF6159 family protein [Thermoplasmata archaeon]|nr:DUF6159 family protein [Thermoplasmata archaeon]
MGRISRGWEMAKTSLRVIKKDKELLLFPVLSGVFTILIIGGFLGGMYLSVGWDGMYDGMTDYVFIGMLIAAYVLAYFVVVFFNAALIGCAMIRLEDGVPHLRDGFRIARENLGRIVAWALFAATVGLILRAIQQRVGFLGKILVGIVGIAWALATFFVVPVLIFEKLGPLSAMKRSSGIFKNVWGETLSGGLGLGLIFFLLGLLGLPIIVMGALLGGITGAIIGIVITLIYWIALAIVASAASGVLVAALYRYATTGKVSRQFASERLIANPWR